jgi:hypothetical protein
MRVDFYLVVFLKFIASIVPTIEVDSTTSFWRSSFCFPLPRYTLLTHPWAGFYQDTLMLLCFDPFFCFCRLGVSWLFFFLYKNVRGESEQCNIVIPINFFFPLPSASWRQKTIKYPYFRTSKLWGNSEQGTSQLGLEVSDAAKAVCQNHNDQKKHLHSFLCSSEKVMPKPLRPPDLQLFLRLPCSNLIRYYQL